MAPIRGFFYFYLVTALRIIVPGIAYIERYSLGPTNTISATGPEAPVIMDNTSIRGMEELPSLLLLQEPALLEIIEVTCGETELRNRTL